MTAACQQRASSVPSRCAHVGGSVPSPYARPVPARTSQGSYLPLGSLCGCRALTPREGADTRTTSFEDRFWAKVVVGDGCWRWLGAPDSYGYGRIRRPGGRTAPFVGAHRAAYELLVGPIPDGLQLDHLCRNRLCVNPDHLEPVTQQENMRRGRVSRGLEKAA